MRRAGASTPAPARTSSPSKVESRSRRTGSTRLSGPLPGSTSWCPGGHGKPNLARVNTRCRGFQPTTLSGGGRYYGLSMPKLCDRWCGPPPTRLDRRNAPLLPSQNEIAGQADDRIVLTGAQRDAIRSSEGSHLRRCLSSPVRLTTLDTYTKTSIFITRCQESPGGWSWKLWLHDLCGHYRRLKAEASGKAEPLGQPFLFLQRMKQRLLVREWCRA